MENMDEILEAAGRARAALPDRLRDQFGDRLDKFSEGEKAVWLRLNRYLLGTVPFHIAALEGRGGPTEWEFTRCCDLAAKAWVNVGADALVFGTAKTEDATLLMELTSEAVAVMAFVPGGVVAFGCAFAAGSANPTRRVLLSEKA